jgi:catechol 2,3-dioxygenase-like lactoylglutathione lyase family enzyme
VLDGVTIRVIDRAASEAFYDTVLQTLGVERTASGDTFTEWGDFSLEAASAERRVTRRLHIGFAAPSRDHVDAFWRAGTAAGHRSDGAPGPRPQYTADYYGAFLLDPDGNSAEAVHHGAVRTNGIVDHLWIRVADVPAAKAFYATIAPDAGLRAGHQMPGFAQFRSDGGSFCLLSGTPTEHLHMAFGVSDDAAAVPVLDPDGNSVELVSARRRGPRRTRASRRDR